MANYDDVQGREEFLVPEDVSLAIIQAAPQTSAALALGRRIPMSTYKKTVTLLDVLPEAYWVGSDTGLKQTTKMGWRQKSTSVEEIAALVVVPDAFSADAGIDLWGEIRPRLAEAVGRKLDKAVFWGIDKPSAWDDPYIYEGVIAAGNVDTESDDLALDVAQLAETLSADGIDINGFVARPGFRWKLAQARVENAPLWQPNARDGLAGEFYGFPLAEARNGSWDPNKMSLLMGDFSRLVVGVRQDITYTISDSAVITDEDGAVIFNAFQQDSKILRVVFRVAYMLLDPSTPLADSPFPFAALRPSGAPAS